VYLIFFLTAIGGEIFLEQAGLSVVTPVSDDAAILAKGVLGHGAFLQAGVALGLISTACYVGVTALFYLLFKPVSRSLAFLALSFGLVAMAISAIGSLFLLAPKTILETTSTGLTAEQLQGLALTFVHVGDHVGEISLVFSGVFQILNGYLIYRSGFLPRILGALMALAGLGWLVFLVPPVANALLVPLEVLGFLGEVPLMLWLLTQGVNDARFNERASAAGVPSPA
jgi:hypothetical protein